MAQDESKRQFYVVLWHHALRLAVCDSIKEASSYTDVSYTTLRRRLKNNEFYCDNQVKVYRTNKL